MMENNMNMDELEQMRQQIQNLKGQINDLARVNDDLLFKSVVDNTRRIRFRVLMSGIGAIAANFIWIKLANDSFVSFPFILFTCGMLSFSIFASLSFNHWQTPTRGENMMKLANELERKRKWRRYSRIISLVLLLVWCVWLLIELRQTEQGMEIYYWTIGGFVVGGFFGILIYQRMKHDYDNQLDNVKKLSGEEE